MDASTEIEFRECPHCHGYGVRDNGKTARRAVASGAVGIIWRYR